jgi:hypothetical protein
MKNIGQDSGITDPSFGNSTRLESSKHITQRPVAFFGRANYSYDDTSLVLATLYREGERQNLPLTDGGIISGNCLPTGDC